MIRESFLYRWISGQGNAVSPIQTSAFVVWMRACLQPLQKRLVFMRGHKTTVFLCLISAAMLFSVIFIPRIPLGIMGDYYRIDLKVEDLLLLLMGIMLAMRSLSLSSGRSEVRNIAAGQTGLFSIGRAWICFLILCQVSIISGLYFKTVDKPLMSMLYLIKWFEYCLVFLAASVLCESRGKSRFFTAVFFLLGVMTALYGYWEHFSPAAKAVYPNYYRLYERYPFHGDANHIGGFLALWLCFFSGFLIKSTDKRQKALLFAGLMFVFFPFIWTYSRKSYFSLAGALGFALLIPGSRKQTIFLISVFVLTALLFPTRLAERMTDIVEVFQSNDPFHSSWAGNVDMWKRAFVNFDHFFIFGSGLGARHRLFYESQYVLLLSETGIAGMLAFVWILISCLRHLMTRFKYSPAAWQSQTGWAWLVALAAMLIHNISCVSWTVSKAAIPFWFLTGYVMRSLTLPESENVRS